MKIDLNCPVELWSLTLPTAADPVCHLTLYNLSDQPVVSMEFAMVLLDSEGQASEKMLHRVHGLHAAPGQVFEALIPMESGVLPARMDIVAEKIWFDMGSIWRRGKAPLTEYTPNRLPGSRSLDRLRTVAGEAAVGYPEVQGDLWLCVCGRPNFINSSLCVRCRQDRDTVFRLFSRESVDARFAEHERQLEEQRRSVQEAASVTRLEADEQYTRRRNRLRRIRRCITSLALAAALAACTVFVVLPFLKYRQGIMKLEKGEYDAAVSIFTEMGSYGDAALQVKKTRYTEARALMDAGSIEDLQEAESLFHGLGAYEDAADQAAEAAYRRGKLYMEQGSGQEAEALFAMLTEENYRDSDDQLRAARYLHAGEMLSAGSWDEAGAIYRDLGDYRDSADLARECLYQPALAAIGSGDPYAAILLLQSIPGYRDADEKLKEAHYLEGTLLEKEGRQEEAGQAYLDAGDCLDAPERARNSLFRTAMYLYENQSYDAAADLFARIADPDEETEEMLRRCLYEGAAAALKSGKLQESLDLWDKLPEDYRDTAEQKKVCRYQLATTAFKGKDYEKAMDAFARLGEYKDSAKYLNRCRYYLAKEKKAAGELEEAVRLWENCGGINDTATQLKAARYALAEQYEAEERWQEAAELYSLLGTYKESAARQKRALYTLADTQLQAGDIAAARAGFAALGHYSDAENRLKDCGMAEAEALAIAGRVEEAAEAYGALGNYLDAKARQQEMYYRLGHDASVMGDLPAAVIWYEKAGDFEDAALLAESFNDLLYGDYARKADKAAADKDDAAILAALAGLDLSQLPQKYAYLGDMWADAHYRIAEALYAGKQYYAALPYYLSIPGHKGVSNRMAETWFRILGTWQDTKTGAIFIFRPDGTCSLKGEEMYFAYTALREISLGDTPDSVTPQLRVDEGMTEDKCVIRSARGGVIEVLNLSRTAPMEQPKRPFTED